MQYRLQKQALDSSYMIPWASLCNTMQYKAYRERRGTVKSKP